jgi:hypothetical protein
MEKANEFNTDLMLTITSDKIGEVAGEVTEAMIDQLLDNGLLKDIPFFGSAVKLLAAGKAIADYFFVKKLIKFLVEIKDIPQSGRIEFAESLEANGHKEAGEKLLFFLNRLDDTGKATIVGKLLSAAILKQISYQDFLRIIYSVDKMFIGDLNLMNPHQSLKETKSSTSIIYSLTDDIKQHLFQVGLLDQYIKDNRSYDQSRSFASDSTYVTPPSISYKSNKYCELLIQYGF